MWETWDMVKCDIWEGLLVFFVSIVACGKEFKCDKRERCLVFPWSVASGTSQVCDEWNKRVLQCARVLSNLV